MGLTKWCSEVNEYTLQRVKRSRHSPLSYGTSSVAQGSGTRALTTLINVSRVRASDSRLCTSWRSSSSSRALDLCLEGRFGSESWIPESSFPTSPTVDEALSRASLNCTGSILLARERFEGTEFVAERM